MESKRKLDDRNELLEYRSCSTPHTTLLDTKMNCSLFKILFFLIKISMSVYMCCPELDSN